MQSAQLMAVIVKKRDGKTEQFFQRNKVETAVRKAWEATEEPVDEKAIKKVVEFVEAYIDGTTVTVEQLQDSVEIALMKAKKFTVAKSYILYRQKRADKRPLERKPDVNMISDYIHVAKYARYNEFELRRETYLESVARVEKMHLDKFSHIQELLPDIKWAFDLVREKKVVPSLRALQFAGKAVEVNHARQYNCSATLIDRPRAFAETLFLLLSGCGVGFSIQQVHVEKLPALKHIDETKVIHHIIKDQIEGWADALDALINSFIDGYYVEFAYHEIRPAGAQLKTSGGRSPGHQALRDSLESIRGILKGACGRKLRPVECHRILCLAAAAVLSGGLRRSAMLSLFSLEDSEMMNLKTNTDWFTKEPYLAYANNSVAINRDDIKKNQFKRIFEMTRHMGEPGFVNVSSLNHCTNPCSEIGLDPAYTDENGVTTTGFSFCNLCEINGARLTSKEDFIQAAKAATIIGTIQASYTDFPYLTSVSKKIADRDALLGISMTGIQNRADICLNTSYQKEVAEKIKEWNEHYAALIGINPGARLTCVKPSGTASLLLGNAIGSGIHYLHSDKYIRRVTADALERPFQKFKEVNPHMCQQMPNGKWSIAFPVKVPSGSALRDDFTAIEFMDAVRTTQENWVLPGTRRESQEPGLRHNVSNTISTRPDEWDAVAEYLWKHRDTFTGVSLLPDTGDTIYPFAPFESVKTPSQLEYWNSLVDSFKPVDYTTMVEYEDDTNLKDNVACQGGACLIV